LKTANATMDHMISLVIFIAALLIFIGLFSQSISTAITYQSHGSLSTKNSDLLDTILLNPGMNATWGMNSGTPSAFGLQDPEFTQYELSSFSLMRLGSSSGNIAEYDKTSPSIYYNQATSNPGGVLLTPASQNLNYSTALRLLGINNTYGFQLTLTPNIAVSIAPTHTSSPLSLAISASGTGFPFANAAIDYCLILATLPQNDMYYPSYTMQNGVTATDQQGSATISFPSVTDSNQVYAFIAYVHMDGVVGIGYFSHSSTTDQYVVPIIKDMGTQQIALGNSYDLNNTNPALLSLKYNATFVISKTDYTLSQLSLGTSGGPNLVGTVTSGVGNPYQTITLPSYTTGILIVTYQTEGSTKGGIVMMPWGISSLAFPVTFGYIPTRQDWVTTDIRQVTVDGIAYQAKLELYNMQGRVIG
jgi:hypothetical protein